MNNSKPKTYYGEYFKNLLIYVFNMVSDYLPILFCFYVFSLNHKESTISKAALIDFFFIFFFGFCYDFFEPVNTLCIPSLVKQNYSLYTLNLCKVALFNALFFIGCFVFSMAIYVILAVSGSHRVLSYLPNLWYLVAYVWSAGLLFIINNFVRGRAKKESP